MALEDLNVTIKVNSAEIGSALMELGSGLKLANLQTKSITTGFGNAANAVSRIAAKPLANLNRQLSDVGHSLHSSAFGLKSLGDGLRLVGVTAGKFSTIIRSASQGMLHMVHSIHAAQIVADLLSRAFSILMVPLRMVGTAASVVFQGMTVALNTVLLPVKWLAGGLMAIARVAGSLAGALASVGVAVFKVWFIFKGWTGALRVLWGWLNMLPPKLRILVGGLLALGAAGKAGSLALGILSRGARLAATGLQLLSLPVLTLTNPMAALRSASLLLGGALLATGRMATRAASGFVNLARSVGGAVVSISGSIAGTLSSAISTGAKLFGALAVAATTWGVKMAVKAEQSAVIFGTMLKDMQQGKALLNALEQWKGANLFDQADIQQSGVLLFKAGVSADQITGKLDQLGNIAAATKTPIEDLARIYQQGMVKGRFQTDLVNQMAERGIDIYHALTAATGKSGAALADMMSLGKIGPAEMNAALAHLTTGTGIYAGAIDNLSATVGGMWSTMMSKVGFAARELGTNVMTAFDFKGLLAQGTELFGNLRTQIASTMPLFQAWANGVKAAFAAVWEVAAVTFNSITSALGMTSGNWMETFMRVTATATWAFKEWPNIATLAFVNVGLSLVRFGEDFKHMFTGAMPVLFDWFGNNWHTLFMNAANLVKTVFSNMTDNIKNAMSNIWNYISSGGLRSLEFAWTPLTEGFTSALTELPDIPPRAIGALEQQLASESERLANALGGSLAEEINKNMMLLGNFNTAQQALVDPVLKGGNGGAIGEAGDSGSAGKGAGRSSFAVDALNRGSEAALKAVYASMGGDKVQDAQLKQQTQMTKHLSVIAKNTVPNIQVQGAV